MAPSGASCGQTRRAAQSSPAVPGARPAAWFYLPSGTAYAFRPGSTLSDGALRVVNAPFSMIRVLVKAGPVVPMCPNMYSLHLERSHAVADDPSQDANLHRDADESNVQRCLGWSPIMSMTSTSLRL